MRSLGPLSRSALSWSPAFLFALVSYFSDLASEWEEHFCQLWEGLPVISGYWNTVYAAVKPLPGRISEFRVLFIYKPSLVLPVSADVVLVGGSQDLLSLLFCSYWGQSPGPCEYQEKILCHWDKFPAQESFFLINSSNYFCMQLGLGAVLVFAGCSL